MKCIICGTKTHILYKDLFDDRYGSQGLFSIYCCPRCGFGRTEPALERKEIGKFYKRFYPLSSLSASVVKSSAKVRPRLLVWLAGGNNSAHCQIKEDSDVLDVGSGSGRSLLEIEKMGARPFGVEPNPSAQKIAKKLKLNVYKGFITENPFPGKKFDYITASQVFEHEPDPLRFLKSARNRLKDSGQIIMGIPNLSSIYRKIFGRRWLNWHVPYHVNFFTEKSLKILAKQVGLKAVVLKTITPNMWTVLQIRSLFVKVHEGEKNPLWSGKTSDFFLKLVNMFLFALVMPINRTIDFFGVGDSLFIILEKE